MGLYRKVSCAYWQGELAESLRGDALAHAVAFYLMTSPATNSIGCYRLSMATLCDDLGEPLARASEALRKLSERGFVVVDERFRMVFVREFARHEFGETPNPADNRVKSLRAALPQMMDVCRKSFVWRAFWDRYGEPWVGILAGIEPPEGSPSEAIGKPFGSPWHPVPDQDQDQEIDQDQEEEPTALVGVGGPTSDDPPETPTKQKPENGKLEEIRWRIEQVWEAHLDMRRRYWQRVEYQDQPPGPDPSLTAPRRKLIGDALRRQDGELLGPDQREAWSRDSKVRAAAIGIFLDKWCGGRAEGNNLAEGGKRYLEPERAFRVINKLDQVERFAELYFERRARKERVSRVEPEDHELEELRAARWEAARKHGEHSPEVDALETEILKRV